MHRASGFTRQEILTAIKVHGSMTTDELGKELGISPVAVRQHLSALEAEGYIAASVQRRGLGRPVHRYTVTSQGDETFPREYDVLANGLLDELQYVEGEAAVASLFAAKRKRTAEANRIRVSGKPLAARVEEIAKMQSEAGYMAIAREDGGGFLLTQHNCSICRVAQRHRCACDEEINLFRELLGDAVA